jgi:regulator of cell morphogenesis and NO signaling
METIEIIDVTVIEPRRKHPYIFERFDALAPGDSFVIANDHDPKPLYYQLQAERGDVVDWDYLENGPGTWKVKIGRKAVKPGEETIGEIVTKDIRKAKIFRKYGIDFCCGGKKTIAEVCQKKNIDISKLSAELNETGRDHSTMPGNPDEWGLDFLANYIVNIHHAYVKNTIPVLLAWSQKVASVHGQTHPETVRIAELFGKVADELVPHMVKEEKVLFPFINLMVNALRDNEKLARGSFGTVANPIRMMEYEHEGVGELYMEIEKLSNQFTPPADACSTFKALYATLKEFEDDLFLHIHLENNILFPKAAILEQQLDKK